MMKSLTCGNENRITCSLKTLCLNKQKHVEIWSSRWKLNCVLVPRENVSNTKPKVCILRAVAVKSLLPSRTSSARQEAGDPPHRRRFHSSSRRLCSGEAKHEGESFLSASSFEDNVCECRLTRVSCVLYNKHAAGSYFQTLLCYWMLLHKIIPLLREQALCGCHYFSAY